MKDQTLKKVHRAEVFDLVSEAGLSHTEFQWSVEDSIQMGFTDVSKLTHIPTNYFFLFDFQPSNASTRFSPGVDRKTDFLFHEDGWEERRLQVMIWLASLKREIETIDPWTQLNQSSELLRAATNETDNSGFSDDELKSISDGINEIKEYLYRVHNLEAQNVEPHMVYLTEASSRLGRKDWKAILVSVLFSIIVDASLPAETTREIFRYVFTVLRPILVQQFLIE